MPQWFRRLGARVHNKPEIPTRPRTLGEIVHGQERKTVTRDGIETVTITPMTAEELRREAAAWRTETRESQWRRLRR